MNLPQLKKTILKEIKQAQDIKTLDDLFKKYLGKGGEITGILSSLKNLPREKKAKIGREANLLKSFLEKEIGEKSKILEAKAKKETKEQWLDITRPAKKIELGHLHPLTLVKRKAIEIFETMGFSVVEGPEIENEWYNFDALNIPKDHPARDSWNTLWLKQETEDKKQETGKLLLRTHTSPVQIHYMEKNNPPLRIIVPGRVFRYEATDVSHEINFYQLEGLMVAKTISVANFKAIIEEFFRRFFGKAIAIRLRPSYFPFTEPSFEVDLNCLNCRGRGCSVCSQTGWLEIIGAGMVHPNVLKNSGLIPKDWQGFAFGIGLDRLAMIKYKINDIRLFYAGDLRFLNQF